jgi:hypothetical protein
MEYINLHQAYTQLLEVTYFFNSVFSENVLNFDVKLKDKC